MYCSDSFGVPRGAVNPSHVCGLEPMMLLHSYRRNENPLQPHLRPPGQKPASPLFRAVSVMRPWPHAVGVPVTADGSMSGNGTPVRPYMRSSQCGCLQVGGAKVSLLALQRVDNSVLRTCACTARTPCHATLFGAPCTHVDHSQSPLNLLVSRLHRLQTISGRSCAYHAYNLEPLKSTSRVRRRHWDSSLLSISACYVMNNRNRGQTVTAPSSAWGSSCKQHLNSVAGANWCCQTD